MEKQPETADQGNAASDHGPRFERYKKPTRNYKKGKKLIYVADFETTTVSSDCRVWGWGMVGVDPNGWQALTVDNVEVGSTLDDFIEAISQSNTTTYFHNLRFDGRFILDWLLKNGYVHVATDNRGPLQVGTFGALISDMGQFYSITVKWLNGFQTEFRDSLKKLPMSVSRIAESFKMEQGKGEIDYEAPRPLGYRITPEEADYIRRDVWIVARAIGQTLSQGMDRLTVGSDALYEYKQTVGAKQFQRTFPVLSLAMDAEIRRAYRGGFTYCDPRYKGSIQAGGSVYDVNSLYPSVMYSKEIPYGEPEYYTGRPKPTATHPLTIFAVTFTARIKPNHIPCIQIKGSLMFVETQYLSHVDEPTTLMLTNVDWALINDHYDVKVVSWDGGWRFRATAGMFDTYIDKWMDVKANSTGGMRELAKLFLNSLYGKFATNPIVSSKIPVLDDDGVVRFEKGPDEARNPIYTAAGVFITSYARDVTIRAAQANYDAFAYADTDSLHLLTQQSPSGVVVHPSNIGEWKHEYDFDAAFYVRAKAYLERGTDGRFHNAIAGVPTSISQTLSFDIIDRARANGGSVILDGKLIPTAVPGGVVLKDTPYELKIDAPERVSNAA